MLRVAIYSRLLARGADAESELGRNDHAALERRQALAHQLFVDERTIYLSGVEQRDTALHGRVQQLDHFLSIGGLAVAMVHAHAAQAERRHLESISEFSLLHAGSIALIHD